MSSLLGKTLGGLLRFPSPLLQEELPLSVEAFHDSILNRTVNHAR